VSRAILGHALLVSALIGSLVFGQETKRTVWDGVYTAAQAERGSAAYAQACSSCHAEDLRGRSTAPSLVEESFLFLWSDMSVGDLFERTRMLMPSDRPGSLPAATYADILAFIAQKNGFPVGNTELGTDIGALKQILITEKRPPAR
jgi:Cytochrome C oxidase, cbb3-type, subunit III